MKNIHLNMERKNEKRFERGSQSNHEQEVQRHFFYLSDEKDVRDIDKCPESNENLFGGSVAHELNNILLVITSNADLLSMKLKKSKDNIPEDMEESIGRVKEAVKRGKELIKEFFASKADAKIEREVVDIKPIVIEVLKQIRIIVSNNIKVNFSCDKDVWRIWAKPLEIYQLVMNLCINSSQAMSARPEGIINVNLSNVKIMNDENPECKNIKCGEYVELTVGDTGEGMKKDVLKRIFEPFFTTKKTEGLGLGLSVVNDIILSLHGGMVVKSAHGKGSVFRVYLPKASKGSFKRFLDK